MKRVIAMITLLVLAGCTAVPSGPASTRGIEPIYLDYTIEMVPIRQIELYGCRNGRTLTCHCPGRIGDCICSCPGVF